jgi:hypothetical protein
MPNFYCVQNLVGKEDYNVWKLFQRTIITLADYGAPPNQIAEFARNYPTDDWNESVKYVKRWVVLK